MLSFSPSDFLLLMSLSVGIVGLPNVGKSTMFNALTNQNIPAENFPFCTIDPNIGIVPVRDGRLNVIAQVIQDTEKVLPPIVPAVVSFTDIAGLVKGASKGEGLGNKFLANIRETDLIAQVVRCFEDENIIHVDGKIDPRSDIETINSELILKDIETLEGFISKNEKIAKTNKEVAVLLNIVKSIYEFISAGKPAIDYIQSNTISPDMMKKVKELSLLTLKPFVYIANVADKDINISTEELREKFGLDKSQHILPLSLKLEAELLQLEEDEKVEFMKELGIEQTGLEKLARLCYKLLGLISFFTAGEKEVRAWTINSLTRADEAAGTIHTDFQKNFVRLEVVSYDDFVSAPGWLKAREKGLQRLEGKTYIVQDGDVIIVRHNA